MSHLTIGAIVFACVLGGALVGMFVRNALPRHHLADESKDVIKLGMGLIATMTALILGLMVASAKSEYDAQDAALKTSAANVVALDRMLARYGPETREIRQEIRRRVFQRVEMTWPDYGVAAAKLHTPGQTPALEVIENDIRELAPKNDTQRWLQARALQLSSDLLGTRWLALARADDTASVVFFAIVVCWLTVLFTSFGLFAPRNSTVMLVLGLCAASVASALFLILELGTPYDGVIKLSSAPLRFALSQLGQ